MTPLTSFILPGGTPLAATLHVARSAARRAERALVIAAENAALNPLALRWINRVSDWLFVAARFANGGGRGDVLWVPGGNR
jgi:cob(I)alamin adenosyltransferase